MDARQNRIVIPFDDFYDQFNPDMPSGLKDVMEASEFESCIQVINKTITFKLLASKRTQRMRLGLLVVLGLCLLAGPLVVLLAGSNSIIAFLVPPAIFFALFVLVAVRYYKNSMNVSQLAAGSIETVLRDFNKKHIQHNMTWRLHKKNTINEDFGFEEEVQQGHVYSYWIEIEILESNFSLLHEASTPKLRPLRPPAVPKSPLSLPPTPAESSSHGPPPPSPLVMHLDSPSRSTVPSRSPPSQPLLSLDGDVQESEKESEEVFNPRSIDNDSVF